MKTEPLFWVPPGANQTRVQFNEFNDYMHAIVIDECMHCVCLYVIQ